MLEFRSDRGKEWAARAHPSLVVAVNRQVGEFWRRNDLRLAREDCSSAMSSQEAESEIPEGAMPISDISRILGMDRATLARWVRAGDLPLAGRFMVKRSSRIHHQEVFTWPGLVVQEIITRNATRTGRTKEIIWIGEAALADKGYTPWLEAADLCLD